MAEHGSFDNLLNQIDGQIGRFNEKRRSNKTKYFWLAIVQIFSGVSATLVLGWSVSPENMQCAKNVALVLTSITTFCTLLLAHFQFKDHYVSFTWVVSQLRQLRSALVFQQQLALENQPAGLNQEVLIALHAKFSAILSESNTDWKTRMKQALADTEKGNS
ncbi:SLATT domain-containing protein [Castellaniella hirudinis]|uniref:SLATT domain-containing protein n=1 Tax=Castellaniella hirudinis TaxID=1144617 RepID=UPI0039C224DF